MLNEFQSMFGESVITIGVVSFVIFIGSLAFTLWLLIKLPHDYWLQYQQQQRSHDHFLIWWLRNLLAAFLALAGVAMLVLPGQGLLTLLIALIVSNFSWKHKAILKLLQHEKIRSSLNVIRRRFHRKPFTF